MRPRTRTDRLARPTARALGRVLPGALLVCLALGVFPLGCAPQNRLQDQGRLPLPPQEEDRVSGRYGESVFDQDLLRASLETDFSAQGLPRDVWGCLEGGRCEVGETGVVVTSNGTETGLYSHFFLPPAFSVEVEYALDDIPWGEGGIGLLVANPDGDGIALGRAWTYRRDFYGAGLVKARGLRGENARGEPTEDLGGRVRLVAGDGKAVCLYERDGEWVELTRFDLPPGVLRLYLLLKGEGSAAFTRCEIKIF